MCSRIIDTHRMLTTLGLDSGGVPSDAQFLILGWNQQYCIEEHAGKSCSGREVGAFSFLLLGPKRLLLSTLSASYPCRFKQYEGKFAALQAINQGLQKENDKLRRELARVDAPITDAGECVRACLCARVCPEHAHVCIFIKCRCSLCSLLRYWCNYWRLETCSKACF